MELIYSMATQKATCPHADSVPPGTNLTAMRKKAAAEASLAIRSEHIRLDNVAEFYAIHEQEEWSVKEDIVNWAPPFPATWFEWNEPTEWSKGAILGPGTGVRNGRVGILVLAMDVKQTDSIPIHEWSLMLQSMIGVPFDDEGRIARNIENSRWVLLSSMWCSSQLKPVCNSPVWTGLYNVMFVDAHGQWIDHFTTGITSRHLALGQCSQVPIDSPLHIVGLGISFMHCKNVSTNSAVADRGSKWHRRMKVPAVTFSTINIDPMKQTLRSEGRSETNGLRKALHICRGHFATYTDENPLFGKVTGTFWKPPHRRGSQNQGTVIKEYSVSAPASEDTNAS